MKTAENHVIDVKSRFEGSILLPSGSQHADGLASASLLPNQDYFRLLEPREIDFPTGALENPKLSNTTL